MRPRIAIILGSGLGELANRVNDPVIIPYRSDPNFPKTTARGHVGALVLGKLAGRDVVVMQGRFHLYEGYSVQQVTYPIDVFAAMGVDHLIVTNAVGAVNESFAPGDLMLITDHINLLGVNPLVGPHTATEPSRFVDMSAPYSHELAAIAQAAAIACGVPHQSGVYAATLGPSLETAAEVRYLRAIGAGAVGMSTVPEVIKARYFGMSVLGISCITNLATGMGSTVHNEPDFAEVARGSQDRFCAWISEIVSRIPQ